MTSKQLTFLLIKLFLGIIYLTSGLSKLAPESIGNLIGPVNLQEISNSILLEIFMTGVAILQVSIGALILSQRYSFFGLILLTPLSLGILIFTIFAGFGLTPIINFILLILSFYAIFQEMDVNQTKSLFQFNSYKEYRSFNNFPQKNMVNIALLLTILAALTGGVQRLLPNFLTTIALILFFINLLQRKTYLKIDYILLSLIFVIGFIIINAILLNQIIPKVFYVVFIIIPLCCFVYLLRVIYSRFISKRVENL